jgi:mutator protein MutT
MIEKANVVAGIFLKNGKFLVERRRSDDTADAGFVCIPGGHVDKGETLEEALKREMREELNIIVKEAKIIFKGLYTASNDEKQLCYYFLVKEWSGNLSSNEATEVFWESDVSKLTVGIDRRAVKVALNL